MLVSELIRELQNFLEEYGDAEVWHEDNECQGYSLSRVLCDEDGQCLIK